MKPMTVNQLPIGSVSQVARVNAPSNKPELAQQLEDIGFIPGEQVIVLRRSLLGDPLMVRIGSSTFALRRAEAQLIEVANISQ
jgi:ferrous iron transport protein A